MPSDDQAAVQAGVDVKVLLTRRLAEALGEDSAIVDFDDLCDRVKAERVQTAGCHVFECRNDRTADSPYCPAHTQVAELLAAAPFPPVDREALLAILADTYGMEGHPDHEHAADVLISAGVVRTPGPELDREELGRLVREVWIGWAREQPNPKPSWLVPWEDLSEPDREVDRRIGETLARAGISAGVDAQPPAAAGVMRIAAERRHAVVEKGFTPEHDDRHTHGELLDAARCYANQGRTWFPEFTHKYRTDAGVMLDQNWPWWVGEDPEGWSPAADPIENLAKAGQFIAAEIDRLLRARDSSREAGQP